MMRAMAYQITGFSIVYSTVCLGADQRKHQSSASLAFVRGIHRWPVDSPHKGQVTQKLIPIDDFIMRIFVIGSITKIIRTLKNKFVIIQDAGNHLISLISYV